MTRRTLDQYDTPPGYADELMAELGPHLRPGTVIDPAAGTGNLLLAARCAGLPQTYPFVGFEADHDRALELRGLHPWVQVYEKDYLTAVVNDRPSLFISNPPYSQAQEFVTKMLDERGPDTVIAALLRLNFLGSRKRNEWWRNQLPRPVLRPLSARPSFAGDGRTDATEYAWFIWAPVDVRVQLSALDWYRGEAAA